MSCNAALHKYSSLWAKKRKAFPYPHRQVINLRFRQQHPQENLCGKMGIVLKFLFLYVLIAAGYAVQKRFHLPIGQTSRIFLSVVMPVFTLGKLGYGDLVPADLGKLLMALLIAVAVCVLCYVAAGYIWREKDKINMKYLVAAAVPNANTGYFGIPVAMLLFSEDLVAKYILANFGIGIFQLTLGYYLFAKSHATVRDSLTKLFSFPAFWAMVAGLAINFFQITLPAPVESGIIILSDTAAQIFFIGGMMIIGMGLANLEPKDINWKTVIWSNILCFALWPLVAWGFIAADAAFLHLLQGEEAKIFWLMAACPVGANAVLYAHDFKLHPGQATLMVMSSTLLAMPILGLAAPFLLQ